MGMVVVVVVVEVVLLLFMTRSSASSFANGCLGKDGSALATGQQQHVIGPTRKKV